MARAADDFTPIQAARWVKQEAPKYQTLEQIASWEREYATRGDWPRVAEYPGCDDAEDALNAILMERKAQLEAA